MDVLERIYPKNENGLRAAGGAASLGQCVFDKQRGPIANGSFLKPVRPWISNRQDPFSLTSKYLHTRFRFSPRSQRVDDEGATCGVVVVRHTPRRRMHPSEACAFTVPLCTG